ncbi:hypothetical protein L6Q96_14950 [Candidatus Binatia bacterium]|nr:hypothetical protein [Candidatus Binatia bacterium]
MLRASATAELAGYPTVSLVCEGFLGQAASTATGLGLPNLPIARVPGHVDTQSVEVLARNVVDVTLPAVIENLTRAAATAGVAPEPDPLDIVFEGTFEEVNRLFCEQRWSDGLPIVPPTQDKIAAFLEHTDLSPDHVIGSVLPDNRAATVWNVAVNGVMAGCRPAYMPILVALAEAMVDPGYGVEHSGNTPGSETLIVLNGPIVRELGFNHEQGALRDGFQSNTTVGRFWRLYLRNVAGFLLHENDKGTYGNTWRVVLAENESVLERIGWPNIAGDQGLPPGTDAVTVARYTGGDVVLSVFGDTPERMAPYLADALTRMTAWQVCFTVGQGSLRPLLLLTPVLAETIANGGWSKADLKRRLWELARMPAWKFERYLGEWTNIVPGRRTLQDVANLGMAPRALFAASTDPDRLVPITQRPEDLMIAVTGDPLRTNAYVFAHNGMLGFPTTKAIRRRR